MVEKLSGAALISLLEKCNTVDEMIELSNIHSSGTEVSDTWLKFWHEHMTDFYGWYEKGSKHLPSELVRRRMVKYEIKEINQPQQ